MVTTEDLLAAVYDEMERANDVWPPFYSSHEGISVLREEYLELEAEIFHGTNERAIGEALQVAAMAVKLLQFLVRKDEDLCAGVASIASG